MNTRQTRRIVTGALLAVLTLGVALLAGGSGHRPTASVVQPAAVGVDTNNASRTAGNEAVAGAATATERRRDQALDRATYRSPALTRETTSIDPLVSNAHTRDAGGRTVQFVAHFTDPGDHLTLGGVDPTCPVGQVAIRGTAHFQAPLRTTDTGVGCVRYDPVAQLNALLSNDGPALVFAGYIDDHQVGSLDGCGTGSFTMHLTDLKFTSFDPAAATVHIMLKWVITPGSGTGAFRGASGEGTGSGDGTFSPDLAVPLLTAPVATPNWGTYGGTITCPHHD